MDITHFATEQAISTMWNRYADPLSLDEIADSAILSKFYFSRVFRSLTGTSPGRFLSAIRLFKAKNLLLETEMSVTEVAYGVGYNSLGTFTSRFTKSVGVTPIQYRSHTQADLAAGSATIPGPDGRPGRDRTELGSMAGWMTLPPGSEGLLMYIGVFDGPILQHLPVSCTLVHNETAFQLDGVPEGEWYVFAAAVNPDEPPINEHGVRAAHLVCREGPVKSVRGQTTMASLEMRPIRPTDPPVLLALPVAIEGYAARARLVTTV